MEVPFVGGSYEGRSKNLNAQICQNLYVEMDEWGKKPFALVGTPGYKLWRALPEQGRARGWEIWKDYLYAVFDDNLYKISNKGVIANVGTLETSSGRVWIKGGTTHLCVVDGTYGYYMNDGGMLVQIEDTDFPTATSLTYQDGYFIVTESGTDSFYISGLEDATSWDGLDFASAEDEPDDAFCVISQNRELWIFGERTTEVFYNSGDSDFPFSRITGGVFDVGLGAIESVACGLEGIFLLDDKYRVQRIVGYQWQQISTPAIEYHIQGYTKKSDAIGYLYTQEGHTFYMLTFPHAKRTWCYDATVGLWHTRSCGNRGERHDSQIYIFFADKHLIGLNESSDIYEFDLGTYTDNGDTIVRKRAAKPIYQDRKLLFHNQFEIEFEAGVGLRTGQGSEPQAMLDWSDDDGHTWSNEHWCSIGKIGEYKNRAIWRRLGRSRSRVYRVTVADPVKTVILGANLEATAGTV